MECQDLDSGGRIIRTAVGSGEVGQEDPTVDRAFDLIVIGSGPAVHKAAVAAAKAGRRAEPGSPEL